RNSTPPARPLDPIILEKTGDGTYRFRIYPVTLGFSRHLRLRYQLPPVVGPEGVQMPIKAAVSSLFPDSRLQVPVTITNGGRTPKIIFAMPGNIRTEMTLPRTRLMTTHELGDQGAGWDEWGNMQSTPGMAIQHVAPLRQAAIKSTFTSGQMAGNYLNLFATVSPEVLKALNLRSASRLAVVVRNAGNAYDFPVACDGGLAVGCGSLMFHGKSDQVWSDTLEWEAYDNAGKLLAKAKVKSTVFESAQDTGVAVLWASAVRNFSEKKELPLGPVFGFVDAWASLLALPKDSISPSLADYYAQNGVPRISNASVKDVIPNYEVGQVPNGPISTGLAAKVGALPDPKNWILERFQGGFIIRIPGLAAGAFATVELFDLAGKRAGYWTRRSETGALNLASAAVRPGIYLLKVRIAGSMSTKRIVL
ncbi:MAG: T9SS type A sorting domain-containing protein, partial [Fibrobacterota bacterium]|nr:T9SS type A sorting domain-containing protein [Fibrobacterota bacterium]